MPGSRLAALPLLLALSVTSALRPPARPHSPTMPPTMNRRAVTACAFASASSLLPLSTSAASGLSRSDGYAVQRSEREWAYVLSGEQYFILRQGGTEQPNTSPLYGESRAGTFSCAGCTALLFSSAAKFDSGTGWPSFATALPAVEVVRNNPLLAAMGGTEVRTHWRVVAPRPSPPVYCGCARILTDGRSLCATSVQPLRCVVTGALRQLRRPPRRSLQGRCALCRQQACVETGNPDQTAGRAGLRL